MSITQAHSPLTTHYSPCHFKTGHTAFGSGTPFILAYRLTFCILTFYVFGTPIELIILLEAIYIPYHPL